MSVIRQCFELNPDQLAIRNILNKDFIEIEIYAISNIDPNRNDSCFTLKSMEKGVDTFVDKPILGYFNGGDFEEHNGKVSRDSEMEMDYWDNSKGEQILGFMRERDQREIVEKDGLSWIRCTAMVYTRYNFKQIKRLLKDRKKKVSVEVDILESEVINGIRYIYAFNLTGITILGSKGGIPVIEGIPGASLTVLDMMEKEPITKQREALVFAYAELNKEEDTQVAKEDIGTGKELKVNKSKEAMSDTDWGEVDKSTLRNRVVAASNFKTIVKDVFLDLREGWEDGEVSKLKYPVMQLKGEDEVVYNRNGLASAKGYAEKNKDEEVLKKLKEIYEDLGLEDGEKFDCSEFCELYDDEDDGDDDDGHKDDDTHDDNNHDNGGKEDPDDDDKDDDKNEDDNSDDDHQNQSVGNGKEGVNFEEQCKELTMKCEEYEKQCADYEVRCVAYEEKCAEYEAKLFSCETELASCKEEMCKFADYDEVKKELESCRSELTMIEQKAKDDKREDQRKYITKLCEMMKLSEEDVKEVREKCENYTFASKEEINKEMAYLSWQKRFSEVDTTETFAVNIVESIENKPDKKETYRDRLKKNLSKK